MNMHSIYSIHLADTYSILLVSGTALGGRYDCVYVHEANKRTNEQSEATGIRFYTAQYYIQQNTVVDRYE